MTALEKYFVNNPGHASAVAERTQELLDWVPVRDGAAYLDLGCGVGAAAREIASSRPFEVTGVDIDPEQIEAARRGGVSLNLRFLIMDATRLEFPDEAFDIVATSKVTHRIPDWEKAFREMGRVLRPGGYLIFSDFVLPGAAAQLGSLLVPAACFPSNGKLEALARESGLKEFYRSRSFAQVDLIWRKSGS